MLGITGFSTFLYGRSAVLFVQRLECMSRFGTCMSGEEFLGASRPYPIPLFRLHFDAYTLKPSCIDSHDVLILMIFPIDVYSFDVHVSTAPLYPCSAKHIFPKCNESS